jgi:hypothetical protein
MQLSRNARKAIVASQGRDLVVKARCFRLQERAFALRPRNRIIQTRQPRSQRNVDHEQRQSNGEHAAEPQQSGIAPARSARNAALRRISCAPYIRYLLVTLSLPKGRRSWLCEH